MVTGSLHITVVMAVLRRQGHQRGHQCGSHRCGSTGASGPSSWPPMDRRRWS